MRIDSIYIHIRNGAFAGISNEVFKSPGHNGKIYLIKLLLEKKLSYITLFIEY